MLQSLSRVLNGRRQPQLLQYTKRVLHTSSVGYVRGRQRHNYVDSLEKHTPGARHQMEHMEFDDNIDNIELEDLDMKKYTRDLTEIRPLYDEHLKEQAAEKRRRAFQRIEKMFFPPEREVNLLTWAEKQQIRHLHEDNPDVWTPEKLAESFPVTKDSVKALLRSNYTLRTKQEIVKHDEQVETCWRNLAKGSVKLSPKQWRSIQNKMRTPLPPHVEVAESNVSIPDDLARPKKVIGPFQALLKKVKPAESNVEEIEMNIHQADDDVTTIPDPDSATVVEGRAVDKNMTTLELYRKKINEQLQKGTIMDNELRGANVFVTEKPSNNLSVDAVPEQVLPSNVDKYLHWPQKYAEKEIIELRYDTPANVKGGIKEAYVYDAKLGYQQPLGSVNDSPDYIKIPTSKWRKGAMYKHGDSFYDDFGNFMYRVPGLK